VVEPGQKDEEVGREDTILRKKLVCLAIAVGAVLSAALLVSLGFALHWYLSPKTDLTISQRQVLVQGLASAGQALAVLLTGAVAFIGLYLTRQNTNEQLEQARKNTQDQLQQAQESQERTQASAQETLRLTERGQLTERFTRAIEQLGATDHEGKEKMEIRLGAIYALERIDKESPERVYHSTIMEVLTAYVRENSLRDRAGASTPIAVSPQDSKQDKGVEREKALILPRLAADIQAILDVLQRREENTVPEKHRVALLDLRGADLRGANLFKANLKKAVLEGVLLQEALLQEANLFRAYLQEANLRGANLQNAKLEGAILEGAILEGAILENAFLQKTTLQKTILRGANLQNAVLPGVSLLNANLQDANLLEADLQRTDLQNADLQDAYLQDAYLLKANLQNANLQDANLQRAVLERTILRGANLQGANLQDAHLRENRWITQNQINGTIGSKGTRLPKDLNRPKLWSKSVEEQKKILQERLNTAE